MASVREIAKQAGVSITTVSRALNNLSGINSDTRKHVLAVANRVGYMATVGRRVTTNIGFVYTNVQTLSHPFDGAIMAGIADGVDQARFDVVLMDMQRDKNSDETYTQFFMRKGVRGVILRTTTDGRDVCEMIAREGFPHVVLSERFESNLVNYIDCDSRGDSILAVEYLLALGHRRIGFAVHNIPDRDHTDRFEGYKEALGKHGLGFDESLIFRQPSTLLGGGTAMELAVRMQDRPTAIYFADPMLAVGAVKRAHAMGLRIPEDMSIVGFDDTETRFMVHPTLTAVVQDARALGHEAAAGLIRLLTDTEGARFQRTIETCFEVHESTAAPSQGQAWGTGDMGASDRVPAGQNSASFSTGAGIAEASN